MRLWALSPALCKQGKAVQVYKCSTGETEAGRSEVRGRPLPHSDTEVSMSFKKKSRGKNGVTWSNCSFIVASLAIMGLEMGKG